MSSYSLHVSPSAVYILYICIYTTRVCVSELLLAAASAYDRTPEFEPPPPPRRLQIRVLLTADSIGTDDDVVLGTPPCPDPPDPSLQIGIGSQYGPPSWCDGLSQPHM